MAIDLLAGVRVVDLSQYLPGPLAAQLLSDLGADVVKVEPPAGDPMRHLDVPPDRSIAPHYELLNNGKTVVRLNLKEPAQQQAVADLVARADVLVESYRPGTLDRLGLGRDRLAALNPSLVHLALSGFGQTGPYRLRAGHDLTYMAIGGGLAVSGTSATPVISHPPIADHAAAVQSALAVVAALVRRGRQPGRGAYLDMALMEAVLAWQGVTLTDAADGRPPGRGRGLLSGGAAYYGIYRCADDRFLALGAIEAKFWQGFCETVGRPDWTVRHAEPLPQEGLKAEVAALLLSQPRDHWLAVLAGVDCCVEAVLEPAEVPDHPQIAARGQVQRHDGLVEALFGLHLDGQPPAARTPWREQPIAAVLAAWDRAVDQRSPV